MNEEMPEAKAKKERKCFGAPARMSIYLLFTLIVIASMLCLLFGYIKSCPFVIADIQPITKQSLLENHSKATEEGKLKINATFDEWNWLVLHATNANNAELGLEKIINGIIYDIANDGADTLYINATDKFNVLYSFKCDSELVISNVSANVNLSNIRLGKYEIPYIGEVFWRWLGLPKAMQIPLNKDKDLLCLYSATQSSNGDVSLTYRYDDEKLVQVLNQILAQSDSRKTEFHKADGDVDGILLQYVSNKQVNDTEARALINQFEKTPNAFPELCYLLNDDGIRTLYDNFGETYYKYISADNLIALSENEISSDLNSFNKRFSQMLLQYLYEHQDYSVENGSLYLNSNKITAESIISNSGGSNFSSAYTIELFADKDSVTAKYSLSDFTAERVILGVNGR